MIFDIKMGENFRRKARMVAGGHTTYNPEILMYLSVVSRDSVRIALTIAALKISRWCHAIYKTHTSQLNVERKSGQELVLSLAQTRAR